MDAWIWIVIAVVVIVAIAVAVWGFTRKRRTEQLQTRFGPEYERTVEAEGDRRTAESELADRVKRREAFDVRPLAPAAAQRYRDEWRDVQGRFVDAPNAALTDADRLVTAVMGERGYPMEAFDQRAADISVDHPQVVDDYRSAHSISVANDEGRASTEDLRRAMVGYRSLFEQMVDAQDTDREASG
jgi:hypothetical protein